MAAHWEYIACQRSDKAEDSEGSLDCNEKTLTQQVAQYL
jgi:hypothetical protein